jgi:putative peptidoglycan lipid II flippase
MIAPRQPEPPSPPAPAPAPAGAPDSGPPALSPEALSVGGRIFRATVLVILAGLLTKLLGIAKNVVAGAWFGTSDGTTDCFLAAFSIVTAVYFVGEECIGPAFLPVYMERRDRDGPAAAWKLAGTVFNLQFLLLLAAVTGLSIWASEIMQAATRWQLEDDLQKVAQRNLLPLAAGFLRWTAPALFGLSLATVTFMLLNARKKFFWASFGEGSLRAVMVAVIVAFGSERWLGGWALPAGVLAGSLAKIGTHLPGLGDELRHYRLRLNLANPDFRRFLVLVAPLVVGSIFAKFRDVFNNVYVMSAAGLAGGITFVYFGRSVVETINSLFPYSLSVGMFPYLCELAEKGDRRALGQVLDRASRFLVFIFLPAAAVLVVAAVPLTAFLFAFGKLSRESAGLIGLVTAASALVMPFYGVERVMMKGYFSNRRTTAPTVIGIVCSLLSMAGCFLFVVKLGYTAERALVVVSLAAVGARVLKVLLLVAVLRRQVPMFELRPTAAFLAKALGLTVAVAAAGYAAHLAAAGALPGLAAAKGLKAKLLLGADLAAIGLAATAAFYVAARLLRMEELSLALEWLRPRAAKLLARLRGRSA